ncbi:MAG: hypothetical protein VX772_06955 [Bacteroidota bacterium]|uniref:MFS transporter n=1 Tax=Flagellimonas okinawensis TaxID=3031324 RepID=A0ABT5XQ83_9FLAO|nr:hypothetical protein [[Muricauda] okinawensis]MDF0708064.1 hypothetical protein [[Muricauda] okinawensis]MEC8832080.1 hypothetical protein [Bacteroidota bacterium]
MQNNSNKLTPGGFLKTISFLHIGISATPVVLGALFYFRASKMELTLTDTDDMFLAIVPMVALAGIFLGDFIFKKMTGSLPKDMDLRTKLNRFQSASILKYALLEGAALFCIVIFANTANLTYLIIAVSLIFYLFFQKPTKQKIENVLDLRGEEKSKFNRTNEPLE